MDEIQCRDYTLDGKISKFVWWESGPCTEDEGEFTSDLKYNISLEFINSLGSSYTFKAVDTGRIGRQTYI